MKTFTHILLAAGVLALAAVGCDNGGRKQSAQLRWEEKMDNVRIEAARQSLAQGRYEYAQRVLEPCMRSEDTSKDAEKLMTEIKAAHQMYAQLSVQRDGIDRTY
jgi:Tfp pilus assembly protein PilF